jgi:hypothetical protein
MSCQHRVRTREGLPFNNNLMPQKNKSMKTHVCVKCGEPAQIHSRGKRAGTYSVYCSSHLLEQRNRNRARSELNRWVQAGGDPAAWAAVTEWKAEELRGHFQVFQKIDQFFIAKRNVRKTNNLIIK